MKLWKQSGNFMIGTGIIHNAIGFFMMSEVLKDFLKEGFINTVNVQHDRNAVFWFLFSGFMMMFSGVLMNSFIKNTGNPVSRTIGWFLLLLTVTGCVMMPVSGFWIVVPQALIIILAKSGQMVTKPVNAV
jgi:hypothetical protein